MHTHIPKEEESELSSVHQMNRLLHNLKNRDNFKMEKEGYMGEITSLVILSQIVEAALFLISRRKLLINCSVCSFWTLYCSK